MMSDNKAAAAALNQQEGEKNTSQPRGAVKHVSCVCIHEVITGIFSEYTHNVASTFTQEDYYDIFRQFPCN